jgi:hypothetical protein
MLFICILKAGAHHYMEVLKPLHSSNKKHQRLNLDPIDTCCDDSLSNS